MSAFYILSLLVGVANFKAALLILPDNGSGSDFLQKTNAIPNITQNQEIAASRRNVDDDGDLAINITACMLQQGLEKSSFATIFVDCLDKRKDFDFYLFKRVAMTYVDDNKFVIDNEHEAIMPAARCLRFLTLEYKEELEDDVKKCLNKIDFEKAFYKYIALDEKLQKFWDCSYGDVFGDMDDKENKMSDESIKASVQKCYSSNHVEFHLPEVGGEEPPEPEEEI